MKTSRILLILFALTVIAVTSCKKDSEPVSGNPDDLVLSVNSNSQQLTQSRMTYLYIPLFDTTNQGFFNTGAWQKRSNALINNPQHQFTLIGELASPVRSGNRVLSATHVEVLGQRAYVSYHYNEPNNAPMSVDLYEGQIDVIDITYPSLPVVLQSAETSRADFNTMAMDLAGSGAERKLWLGATDFGVGGAVFTLTLQNGEIPAGATLPRTKTPPGKSVNGLARSADWLYVTAGRTAGGSFSLNAATMAKEGENLYSNAKYTAVTGTTAGSKHVVLRSGTTAQLLVYDVSAAHTLLNTFDIGSISPEDGKSVLFVKDNLAWVAMGYAGLKAFDLNTGNVVHTLSPSSMSPESITNGVSADEYYVYVANGSGGLYLCQIVPGQTELEVLGIYQYGASANYVAARGNYIFIANGREGLKILHRVPPGDYKILCDYNSLGVPLCLEPNNDPLCPTLLGSIMAALPEQQNAIVNHPEYFTNPHRNVVLNAPATVYVVFLDEGAGFKNSLGLYWYDVANPPAVVGDLSSTKTLIYPNASKVGSGGGLIPGNLIHMVGTFPAGTSIGAFLITNSWQGISPTYPTGLSQGLYTNYTDKQFNLGGGLQQSLLFYDATCDAVVLTFEDILTTGGDKDFNDCIFKIIVDPPTAIDPSLYNQL